MTPIAAPQEPEIRMSRAEYRAWAARQPGGRYERMNGVVVAMAPERAGHNDRKALVWLALRRAVQAAGLDCHTYTDGMTVEVGESDYEPDAVVRCGPELPDDAVAVPDPLIIVEVLSPSTSGIDRAVKLIEYFRLPTVHHYLIVSADKRQIVHHRRGKADEIATQVFVAGEISLDPPGLVFAVEQIYAPN